MPSTHLQDERMDPGVELAQGVAYVSVGIHKAARPPVKSVGTPISRQRIVKQFVDQGRLVAEVVAIVAMGLRTQVNAVASPVPQIIESVPDNFPLCKGNRIK